MYKTYDGKYLAIVEAFRTWRHYLEGSQHKVLVLTDHNNLQHIIDTKSLSSKQVCWTQELSHYQFQINYCQGKTNKAANTLYQYSQQSAEEKETFQADNIKILYRSQSSLTNASLSSLSTSAKLLPLQQVFICGTYVLSQL